jgi:hypothetical protein
LVAKRTTGEGRAPTISHAYLERLLLQQTVPPGEVRTLQTARQDIETKLRRMIGSVPRFYYGGSYGKDTMIRVSYDLDIVVYFSHTDSTPVRDTYANVYHGLKNTGYVVQPKTVAIRLPYEGGFHIDVGPGRAQDATLPIRDPLQEPGRYTSNELEGAHRGCSAARCTRNRSSREALASAARPIVEHFRAGNHGDPRSRRSADRGLR